jgi:unsaturated chondroitin disaccharide hydrolase
MWSRGQAWAIYGYTMVYRFTRDERFLTHARKVTDCYLNRLAATSDDNIPLWDMDDTRGTAAPKDASAAAIVASALIELAGYVEEADAQRYSTHAKQMLADLGTSHYRCGERSVAFVRHATGHHPAGSEIDASIIYADYYYIEALLRMKKLQK